jgi:prepilin-type N-terminal cleavage/methylation domain-containing protein
MVLSTETPRHLDERGFTLVEMLVAMLILMVGIVASLSVFSSSRNATLASQRHEVAVHQAQRELERLRALDYSELGMTSAPSPSADPRNPNCRVQSGGKLRVKPVAGQPCAQSSSSDEAFVLTADVPGGKVDPTPTSFTVGDGTADAPPTTGKIYRYVTWRDETCLPGICDDVGGDVKNTKRLLVAISLDPVVSNGNTKNIGPRNPVWITSIATDPKAGTLTSGQGNPPPAPSATVQNFYLYDKTCSDNDTNNGYASPPAPPASGPRPGDHVTHDTAAPATSCENVTASKRPDLMGPAVPTYGFDAPIPPYRFSNDPQLTQSDYPAGLALSRTGAPTTCPASSYQLDTGNSDNENPPNTSTPGKWQVHGWGTRKFGQDFALSGKAYLSIWTTSVGSTAGAGRFCATLVDRLTVAGVPNDVQLGSMGRTYSPWPTTKNEPGRYCGSPDFPCGRQLTFQFSVNGTKVRSGGRLMLFVSVLGSSDKDIVLLYDDPRYRSFVQIETATPCSSSGQPCPTT